MIKITLWGRPTLHFYSLNICTAVHFAWNCSWSFCHQICAADPVKPVKCWKYSPNAIKVKVAIYKTWQQNFDKFEQSAGCRFCSVLLSAATTTTNKHLGVITAAKATILCSMKTILFSSFSIIAKFSNFNHGRSGLVLWGQQSATTSHISCQLGTHHITPFHFLLNNALLLPTRRGIIEFDDLNHKIAKNSCWFSYLPHTAHSHPDYGGQRETVMQCCFFPKMRYNYFKLETE